MATNSQIAFAPLGETVAITANATAPDGVQVLVAERNSANSPGQYRVINAGTVIVHLKLLFLAILPLAFLCFLALLKFCASVLKHISAAWLQVRRQSISRPDKGFNLLSGMILVPN